MASDAVTQILTRLLRRYFLQQKTFFTPNFFTLTFVQPLVKYYPPVEILNGLKKFSEKTSETFQ